MPSMLCLKTKSNFSSAWVFVFIQPTHSCCPCVHGRSISSNCFFLSVLSWWNHDTKTNSSNHVLIIANILVVRQRQFSLHQSQHTLGLDLHRTQQWMSQFNSWARTRDTKFLCPAASRVNGHTSHFPFVTLYPFIWENIEIFLYLCIQPILSP